MNSAEALASGQDVTVKSDGDCELSGVSLPGLPEGLVAEAYRIPEQNDYYIIDGWLHQYGQCIGYGGPFLIVKALPGYRLIFEIETNRIIIQRLYRKPRRITVHFAAETDADEVRILRLKSLPGFDRISEPVQDE